MTTTVTRNDFAQLQGITPKLLRFFEENFALVATNTETINGQISATGSLQQATVITLSSNDAFQNERVLTQGAGVTITSDASTVTISMTDPISTNGGYNLTFNLLADTDIDIPFSGAMATTDLGGLVFADDASAAAGGVAVGEMYKKTGGTLAWRVA